MGFFVLCKFLLFSGFIVILLISDNNQKKTETWKLEYIDVDERQSVHEELAIPQTMDHGSILSRNRFGYKFEKPDKQACFPTIGSDCWKWTSPKTMENKYFVNMSSS